VCCCSVTQHAKHVGSIILSSVACLAVPYLSTLSHKRHDFREKKLLYIKCVFWVSLQFLSETFLILRGIQGDVIKNVYRSSSKVPVILVGPYPNLNFLDIFSKKYSNIEFHENPSHGSRVVSCRQTDGQTDMTKIIVAFRNFTNAPKDHSVSPYLRFASQSKA